MHHLGKTYRRRVQRQNLDDVAVVGASTTQTISFNNTNTAFKTATPTSTTTCGIANTSPIHTLDIGSNVAIIDDGIDKLLYSRERIRNKRYYFIRYHTLY